MIKTPFIRGSYRMLELNDVVPPVNYTDYQFWYLADRLARLLVKHNVAGLVNFTSQDAGLDANFEQKYTPRMRLYMHILQPQDYTALPNMIRDELPEPLRMDLTTTMSTLLANNWQAVTLLDTALPLSPYQRPPDGHYSYPKADQLLALYSLLGYPEQTLITVELSFHSHRVVDMLALRAYNPLGAYSYFHLIDVLSLYDQLDQLLTVSADHYPPLIVERWQLQPLRNNVSQVIWPNDPVSSWATNLPQRVSFYLSDNQVRHYFVALATQHLNLVTIFGEDTLWSEVTGQLEYHLFRDAVLDGLTASRGAVATQPLAWPAVMRSVLLDQLQPLVRRHWSTSIAMVYQTDLDEFPLMLSFPIPGDVTPATATALVMDDFAASLGAPIPSKKPEEE